ncbi:hypothetical protein PAPYR_10324 [Paratrimastix pyriformis]|uniref:Uncharacterized protein n=1 Tax=Paratrimastix pyriformis TaxID=342808 RepID=A0ABQ8U697_9EUKA|nr:hypothetical protein PAPYR_10324 [Paratrimastix pyriformis]
MTDPAVAAMTAFAHEFGIEIRPQRLEERARKAREAASNVGGTAFQPVASTPPCQICAAVQKGRTRAGQASLAPQITPSAP